MAIFYQDAVGAQQWKKAIPLFGNATNIVKGAFVLWGTTASTNQGFGIVHPTNSSSGAQFIGISEALFAAATLDNDPSAGTKYLTTDCTINPHGIYLAQYDNALTTNNWTNGLTITAVTIATPSVTVTSLENISGGWVFFDNQAGATTGFELRYVLSVAAGVATLKSATSSNITTSNKLAKIYYPSETKVTLVTAADKIGIATAAQGAVQLTVLDNFIKGVGFDWVSLDPTKHDGLILSSAVTPAIWATVQSTQHFLL